MSQRSSERLPLAAAGRGLSNARASGRIDLFKDLRGRGAELEIDTKMAVMLPIVAAMLADGRVEQDELSMIESICATSPIFERNSTLQNERMILIATHLIEDIGLEAACRRAAAVLSAGLRETAFAYAAKMIFSDGYIGEVERDVVASLAGLLEIGPDRARTLIDVVSVLQHPETA